MKLMFTILNPWQGTFNRLGLYRRWWHRLAVVTFFIALLLVLGASWGFAFSYFRPVQSLLNIQYTPHAETQAEYDAAVEKLKEKRQKGIDVSEYESPVPVGTYWELPKDYTPNPAGRGIIWDAAEVVMPDGTTADFESAKAAERTWNKALHAAKLKEWTLSTTVAIVLTLSFSYLLMSLYRTLLYVVYGSAKT